jgi:hypothetical protein
MGAIVAWLSVLSHKYYDVVFTSEQTVTNLNYTVCVEVICLVYFIEDGIFGNALVRALAVAIDMFIAFLRVSREGRGRIVG